MKILRALPTYILFFILGLILAVPFIGTGFSYYAIDLSQKNPNLQELTSIGYEYVKELNAFDQLSQEVSQKALPPSCSVVCAPSQLDAEQIKSERSFYLQKYFANDKIRALKDPQFRLKLKEVAFLSELFPPPFRKIITQLKTKSETEVQSSTSKFILALQLEAAIFVELTQIQSRFRSLQEEKRAIDTYRELIASCRKGLISKAKAQVGCEAAGLN